MSTVVHHRPLLTVEETAERLRVSPKTVRRFIDAGVYPALRVGASIRVDEGELNDWLYADVVASSRPHVPAERGGAIPSGGAGRRATSSQLAGREKGSR
jgi:excisionase family DNA binding protein